jgi:hypothetical protein
VLDHPADNQAIPAIIPSVPPKARTNLMAGDLVEVNCSSLNARAWMSPVAPVERVLPRGARAELLSGPTRSERGIWVQIRLLDDAPGESCFVAASYLDLVEARASLPLTVVPPSVDQDIAELPYRIGDIIRTTVKVNLREAPGTKSPKLAELARGTVGSLLAGPERLGATDWVQVELPDAQGWLAAGYTRLCARGPKWIEVDLATQSLTAWNNGVADARLRVSSGKPGFGTPAGSFTILEKHPARRLSATVKGEHWDIPGVPWIMVFRSGGFYVHGVYWHNDFGSPQSHGCVTLGIPDAEWLYQWTPLGASIWIHR